MKKVLGYFISLISLLSLVFILKREQGFNETFKIILSILSFVKFVFPRYYYFTVYETADYYLFKWKIESFQA